MKIFFLFLILFSTAFSVFSQNIAPQSQKKIAFINSFDFEDEKSGVQRLALAVKFWENECVFEYPRNFSNIKLLENQLESNKLSDEDKLQLLSTITELKKEDEIVINKLKANYQKRYDVLVKPVFVEIDTIVKHIGKQNNLIILKSELLDEKGQILAFDPKFDITASLIPSINDYFKNKTNPKITIDLPDKKIGTINMETVLSKNEKLAKFWNFRKEVGVENSKTSKTMTHDEWIILVNSANLDPLTEKKLYDSMQIFALEKGLSMIFDFSKELPSELKDFHIQDVTNEFISYYNQLNH